MKIVLQLFPTTVTATRVDCEHVALLSPTCVVGVTPPPTPTQKPESTLASLRLCAREGRLCRRQSLPSLQCLRTGWNMSQRPPPGESAGSRWEVREVRSCQAVDWC